MRILLAEDEKLLSKAIVKIFEKNNYSVDAVFNGKDALTYIQLGNYDCAVLDIMMPHEDGVQVLRKIREFSTVPALFLTAKIHENDKAEAYESGGDDYLTKPFSQNELLKRRSSLQSIHCFF